NQTTNKPAYNAIWKYGNVEGGFSYLPDDSLDPRIGEITSERIQLQYRIRVVNGLVGLASHPSGFDPAVVKARGASPTDTHYTFQNMGKELGDPGLWRAGDGTQNALGTVDGYVYAIPIAAVFRRNSAPWVGDPFHNLNGAFNRNPTAVSREDITTFTTPATLATDISSTATSFTLVSADGIPLPKSPPNGNPVLIQIGDEMMTYEVITGTTVGGVVRGVYGSRAEFHK